MKIRLAGSTLLAATVAALVVSMSIRVHPVAASNAQNGQLHIVKDCSAKATLSLPYCTITSSSLAEIPLGDVRNPGAGSLVIYDQPGTNLGRNAGQQCSSVYRCRELGDGPVHSQSG